MRGDRRPEPGMQHPPSSRTQQATRPHLPSTQQAAQHPPHDVLLVNHFQRILLAAGAVPRQHHVAVGPVAHAAQQLEVRQRQLHPAAPTWGGQGRPAAGWLAGRRGCSGRAVGGQGWGGQRRPRRGGGEGARARKVAGRGPAALPWPAIAGRRVWQQQAGALQRREAAPGPSLLYCRGDSGGAGGGGGRGRCKSPGWRCGSGPALGIRATASQAAANVLEPGEGLSECSGGLTWARPWLHPCDRRLKPAAGSPALPREGPGWSPWAPATTHSCKLQTIAEG